MMEVIRRALPLAAFALLVPISASAQAPGMGPGGTVPDEAKPEGAAEKAPPEAGQLPVPPVLPPYPNEKRKQLQLFELDGYFRVRTDWMSNLHLGYHDLGSGTPYAEPISCQEGVGGNCKGSLGSANLRLRLEPTVNLSRDVAVKFQLDVLDNLTLGSTPEGIDLTAGTVGSDVGVGALSGTEATPADSIRAKRAWAEVQVPIGLLKFGRMPDHFGLGIRSNSGSLDPYSGAMCLDCDSGDSADRIIFSTRVPGTRFNAAIGLDWIATQPDASQSLLWQHRNDGQPWDLDDADDATQYLFVLGRFDEPRTWKQLVEDGRLALNYGVQVAYRTQGYDTAGYVEGDELDDTTVVPRHAKAYIPDAYVRLAWGRFRFDAEAVGLFGSMDLTTADGDDFNSDLAQIGGVARAHVKLVHDSLDLGLEAGFASGDQWDADPQGATDYHLIPAIPGDASDTRMTGFVFDPNYHVDLILFRELIGAVTNATYVKPTVQYTLADRFVFTGQGVLSMANKTISTPGNGRFYGIELDADLGYQNVEEGFFAGLSYGVLFPLDALDHPLSLGYDSDEGTNAGTAQTFQTRLVVSF